MEARWWIRSGLLLAALVTMMLACAERGEKINPRIHVCLLKPREHHGRLLWIPGARVKQRAPDHVILQVGDVTVRGTGNLAGIEFNDDLWISGTFRAPDQIDIVATRKLESAGERWVLNGVSAGVLVALGVFASRRLRPIHPGRPLIEGGR